MQSIGFDAFPLYKGPMPGAIDTSADGAYNFVNVTLMNYLTVAYNARRGGVRYKLLPRGYIPSDSINTSDTLGLTVCRGPSMYSNASKIFDISSDSNVAHDFTFSGAYVSRNRGTIYFSNAVNPVAEFEVPFYSHYRFYPGKQLDFATPTLTNQFYGYVMEVDSYAGIRYYTLYAAAAEDFSLNFFCGWPRMCYEPDVPDAA